MVRILIAEDDEMNRDMLSRRLVRHGFEVILAVDGLDAVAKVQAELPDLILMDMKMPNLDGYGATKQLRDIPGTSKIPIIALTAYAMSGDCERALAVGCDDYDTKPVDLPRLLVKMQALLQKRG